MFKTPLKGERKVQHVREQSLYLLAGLTFCVYAKADIQLYIAYAGGLAGLSTAFMWGNRGEHAAASTEPTKP